jgi:hypothetical protein
MPVDDSVLKTDSILSASYAIVFGVQKARQLCAPYVIVFGV